MDITKQAPSFLDPAPSQSVIRVTQYYNCESMKTSVITTA